MSNPKFAGTYNLVAFLEKPEVYDGFEEIVDFLNESHIKYALTVNPTAYESCIQQFWATTKGKTVNEERQIQALVDKKQVILTETSIRQDLKLDDAKGTDCLPNDHLEGGVKILLYLRFVQAFLNKQVEGMSKHKKVYVTSSHTKKFFANMKREGKNFSGRITPLFSTMMVQATEDMDEDLVAPIDSHSTRDITQPSSSRPQKKQKSRKKQRKETKVSQDETQHDDSVPTPSNDPPPSGEDRMQLTELMILCTNLQKQVLDLEKAKDAQAKEIAGLKKRVQKLERKKKSRTTRLKRLRKVGESRRVESSKDKDNLGDQEDPSKQGRKIANIDQDAEVTLIDETQRRLNDEDMFGVNDLHGDEVIVDMAVGEKEEQSTKVDKREVSTGVEDSVAPTIPVTTAGEGVTAINVEVTTANQVALDEEMARNIKAQLQAKLIKEERLSRKMEEEANIALIESWENIQGAMMEA
ncbi:hypothetical protein Tco_0979075 [Tanacetum coccineum]